VIGTENNNNGLLAAQSYLSIETLAFSSTAGPWRTYEQVTHHHKKDKRQFERIESGDIKIATEHQCCSRNDG